MSLPAGPRVGLRPVTAADLDVFVARAGASAAMYEGFVSMPTTAAGFHRYLGRFDGVAAIGLVLTLHRTGELAGFINITRVERRSLACASIGFGGFEETSGHRYVEEGVLLVVRYAFGELGLDRLEADVQPGNVASRQVVVRAGFRPPDEGSERVRIRVGGEWRDHERWAIMADGGRLTDI
ncbi:GNAT family protein [Spirillospora sp. NPDC047279]|uniref:GNAT family N-acetyltransferase n=1 Tax=Spirillospora sp. NPDC047279 TaxID=3155478 RepID=UPI0033E3C39D